ncbi:MAG: hypothetical protein KDD34_05910 [Bdellovibrionales bacterium]|nr:hypothetical protein [Bdellovibrionales bacterium]
MIEFSYTPQTAFPQIEFYAIICTQTYENCRKKGPDKTMKSLSQLFFFILISCMAFGQPFKSFASEGMSRRGFLKLLGKASAGAAAMTSLPTSATIEGLLKEDGEHLGIDEMLEAYRKELIDSGLLRDLQGPISEGQIRRLDWYQRLLANAMNSKDVPKNIKKMATHLYKEFKIFHPSQIKISTDAIHTPNNHQDNLEPSSEISSQESTKHLKKLIKIREQLSPTLLVRMAWQFYFINDLVLKTESPDDDIEDLETYFNHLVEFIIEYEQILTDSEPHTLDLAEQWLYEVSHLFEIPVVQEAKKQRDSCSLLLNSSQLVSH